METINLYNAAEKSGIIIEKFELPLNKSISALSNGRCYIALDSSVTGAEEKVCLAHELGHCETMSFYNVYSPLDVRGKHEVRAERWAIKKLIPKTAYHSALEQGYTEVNSLAEYFNVTPEFMQKAVEYYRDKI